MASLARGLLAAAADAADHGDGHSGGHGFTFEDVLALGATVFAVVLCGMMAARVGLPALVGEILAGILVGPHGLELAPQPVALMLIGELGLILMVLEAGLEVDLAQLALVGKRGVMVAVAGSLGACAPPCPRARVGALIRTPQRKCGRMPRIPRPPRG